MTDRYNQIGEQPAADLAKRILLSTLLYTIGSFWLVVAATTLAAESKPGESSSPAAYNRLKDETSPYLLQHATNPIDWYPWGEEAFEKARKENKPVFLSIGYSTCHWCHVMEKESFADVQVAALLNRFFVSIKVDREERPDIDHVYMTVTQAITGRGGWPNNVFLTPEKKPFFAGTYFPKEPRWGLPGLMELLPRVAEIWENDREKILESAAKITASVSGAAHLKPGEALGAQSLAAAHTLLARTYDNQNGGFGESPKFPTAHKLSFLLRRYYYNQDKEALEMAVKSLTRIRLGGIYDHIGFGFHRYATDAQWRVPHFEKMLYDQALLTIAYTEAYQATGKPLYARTVREVLGYILRDMTSPEGGFYSAEDADSEGVEGKFYLWTTAEIEETLGKKSAQWFQDIYNLETGGNFTSPEPGHAPGGNILYLTKPPADLAADRSITKDVLLQRLEKNRLQLFDSRSKRVPPFKDDKILTDWNGLMIAAFARAGRVLDQPRYISAAEKAAGFIRLKLQDKDARLLKRYRKGKAGLPAHLNDYAFVVWGLLELYESTFKPAYLRRARTLTDQMISHFWDESAGGFFMTADDSEKLLIRSKQIYDGAIPSGNSVAAVNLLRLGHMTGSTTYLKYAEQITEAFSGTVEKYPAGHTHLMLALEFALNPSFEVVIAGTAGASDTQAMLEALRRPFSPGKVVVFRPADPVRAAAIIRLAPYTEHMIPKDDKATAYVCSDFVCKLPTTDITQMLANLKPVEP